MIVSLKLNYLGIKGTMKQKQEHSLDKRKKMHNYKIITS